MKRKELASEITSFALEYGIFNTTMGTKEIEQKIEEQFIDCVFVEELINKIIVKTKDHEDIDTGRLINLLAELERLRLELEYTKVDRKQIHI